MRQYDRIRKYLQNLATENGFAAVESVVESVRNSMTFVFILLKDPGSATTVFEGLNDPGIPIAVGDLVKNEVFAKVGYDEPTARALHDSKWIPFRDQFGHRFNDYFFPFSVVHRTGTSRTEMFAELRKLWKDKSASEIIDHLEVYSIPFKALNGLVDPVETYGKEIGSAVQRLVDMKCPSSTYPFLMQLLRQCSDSAIAKEDALGSLVTIESFLARRALCGIEPTGLLGLFRTMWARVGEHPSKESVSKVIIERLTVEWPGDGRLSESIKTRPLYGSSIARYGILEYDRAKGRDHPGAFASIEHVMPKAYADSWSDVVSKSEHAKLKNLWANLVPLSTEMNSFVDQLPYVEKRKVLAEESMFASARRLANDYESWDASEIEKRSKVLASWSLARWPGPSKSDPTS